MLNRLARNAAITVGIVADLLSGDMPGLSSRTLISFAPERELTVDNGVIVHQSGTWPEPAGAAANGAPLAVDTYVDVLPPAQRQLLRQATRADVGWLTSVGLSWFPQQSLPVWRRCRGTC